jgi:predicted NBD/HSP70 family sugar kinase
MLLFLKMVLLIRFINISGGRFMDRQGSKKTANMEIKKLNRTSIYQLVRKNNGLSNKDIVQQLQLCLPTVTQNISEMMSEGLIEEYGSIGNTGGRRAKTYGIRKDARTAIGLDITKNHITVVAVDLTGSILACERVREKFERSDRYYRKLNESVSTIIKKANLDTENILGVGIGLPGLTTTDNQTVFYGKILNFTGATCSEFSKYIPYKTALFNDANAAGFAEIWSRDDIRNAFYVMLSTNIGGSIVINGQIYQGELVCSGEVGHMTIVPDGRKCYCGQKGCVDAYCAATELSSLTDGNLSDYFALLDEGNPQAVKLWDEYLDHLSITVNNLHVLFDCTIILGGYVGGYIDKYMDELIRRAKELNSFQDNADYLKVCCYKTEAIAAGAALNFIADFIDTI